MPPIFHDFPHPSKPTSAAYSGTWTAINGNRLFFPLMTLAWVQVVWCHTAIVVLGNFVFEMNRWASTVAVRRCLSVRFLWRASQRVVRDVLRAKDNNKMKMPIKFNCISEHRFSPLLSHYFDFSCLLDAFYWCGRKIVEVFIDCMPHTNGMDIWKLGLLQNLTVAIVIDSKNQLSDINPIKTDATWATIIRA